MKRRSMRQMMYYIIGGFAAAFLLFCFLMAYSNNRTIRRLSEIVQVQLDYNAYQEKTNELQEAVAACFNQTGTVTEEELRSLCGEFQQYTDKLSECFSHPQFVDNTYIVQAYIRTIMDFMENGQNGTSEEQYSYYNATVTAHHMVLQSYETTAPYEEEIITGWLNESTAAWQQREKIIFILGILVCIIAIWRGRRLVNLIVRPVGLLTEQAKQVVQKNYGEIEAVTGVESGCRETALLMEAFREMLGTIRKQMGELEEKIAVSQKLHKLEMENMQTKISLNQTEMCLMQSLISPHFLFNCLNTLTSLAFIEGAQRTEECSIQLAKYLREFLEHVGKTITVKEEVSHTKEYISIQKQRFGKRIQFEVECEKACEDKEIPAIILQPLIENALTHGLKNCRSGGLIRVSVAKREDGSIRIEVTDNGAGVSPETIRQVEDGLKKPFESGGKGIGLRSVAYRLNDFFGGNASLRLESREEGARVAITLPA